MGDLHLPDGFLPDGHLPTGHLPADSGGAVYMPPRRVFYLRAGTMRRLFYARLTPEAMGTERKYRFDDVTKNPSEQYEVELNLFDACASKWRPNEPFSLNEYIRPTRGTGFAYQVQTADGVSGMHEPRWPKTVAGTVPDGSITWKCVAAASNGIYAISSPAGASDPSGLTISSVSVNEDFKIFATYQDGTVDTDYLVEWQFTLNGVPRYAHQLVHVAIK